MSNVKDYLYTEEVQIPSKGLLNPEIPDGKITIRCVELRDQKYLAGSKTIRNNKAVELLQRCVIKPEGFDITNLTQVDLFFLLVKLRVLSYGEKYTYIARCPVCGQATEVVVDLTNLNVVELENFNKEDLKIVLPRRGDTVYTHMQTQKDADEIEDEAQRLRAKFKDNLEGAPEITISLAKIIDKIVLKHPNENEDKEITNPVDILNYVENLMDLDALAIKSTIDNVVYGIEPTVTTKCDKCNSEINVLFRTTAEFFRPRFGK